MGLRGRAITLEFLVKKEKHRWGESGPWMFVALGRLSSSAARCFTTAGLNGEPEALLALST
jgi:hypothetical protein